MPWENEDSLHYDGGFYRLSSHNILNSCDTRLVLVANIGLLESRNLCCIGCWFHLHCQSPVNPKAEDRRDTERTVPMQM